MTHFSMLQQVRVWGYWAHTDIHKHMGTCTHEHTLAQACRRGAWAMICSHAVTCINVRKQGERERHPGKIKSARCHHQHTTKRQMHIAASVAAYGQLNQMQCTIQTSFIWQVAQAWKDMHTSAAKLRAIATWGTPPPKAALPLVRRHLRLCRLHLSKQEIM